MSKLIDSKEVLNVINSNSNNCQDKEVQVNISIGIGYRVKLQWIKVKRFLKRAKLKRDNSFKVEPVKTLVPDKVVVLVVDKTVKVIVIPLAINTNAPPPPPMPIVKAIPKLTIVCKPKPNNNNNDNSNLISELNNFQLKKLNHVEVEKKETRNGLMTEINNFKFKSLTPVIIQKVELIDDFRSILLKNTKMLKNESQSTISDSEW